MVAYLANICLLKRLFLWNHNFNQVTLTLIFGLLNPFSAGTAFMLMQTGWIQASRRVTRWLAWDPTCLLLSPSFPPKNKQNLKVLKRRLFLENYPAFKGLTLHHAEKFSHSECYTFPADVLLPQSMFLLQRFLWFVFPLKLYIYIDLWWNVEKVVFLKGIFCLAYTGVLTRVVLKRNWL